MVSTQRPVRSSPHDDCDCLSVLQTGYIVSTDGLLSLFDADCGILVVGEGARILGLNQHSQEILIMAEYLRLKRYRLVFSLCYALA